MCTDCRLANYKCNVYTHCYSGIYFKLCPGVPLAPFGPEEGDTFLKRGSNMNSAPILLSPAFPYFGHNMTSLYVNTNGYISFQQECTDCFFPVSFPFLSPPLVAVLWHDYDTSRENTGSIFYRITRDQTFLRDSRDYIFNERGESFNPSYAVIVTWVNVTSQFTSALELNTFQAILATDGYSSYVLFAYGDLQLTGVSEVGFNLGDGLNFLSVASVDRGNSFNIQFQSNVRSDPILGRYLYRVDGKCSIRKYYV